MDILKSIIYPDSKFKSDKQQETTEEEEEENKPILYFTNNEQQQYTSESSPPGHVPSVNKYYSLGSDLLITTKTTTTTTANTNNCNFIDEELTDSQGFLEHIFGFSSTKKFISGAFSEMNNILEIAIPMALTQLCTQILEFEDLMFVGHLGSTYLAAAALGSAYFICLSWLASGLATALDTLISQAYGAKQHRMIGIAGNRGIIITTIACIPIAILYWFATDVFILARQDVRVARLSGQYVRYLIPGLWPLVMYRTLTSYLVNQNMQKYPMIISLSTVVINLILGYLMVVGVGFKGLGFIGAPIASSLTRCIQFVLLSGVIFFKKLYRKTWTGFHLRETFQLGGLFQFLRLGIPGMFMDVLDIWVFEGSAIPSGILGDSHLAAHSVILNIYLIAFMIPLGIGIGGSARVGMGLGAGKPKRARLSCVLTIILAVAFQATLCTIVFLCRFKIGLLFTSDHRVLSIIARTIPISVSFQIFDAINAGTNGSIKGIGKQSFGFLATLIAYWGLGFPLGNWLAFYFKLQLAGLWLGLAIGASLIAIASISVLVFFVDWNKESEMAVQRSREIKKMTQQLSNDSPTSMEDTVSRNDQSITVGSHESDSLISASILTRSEPIPIPIPVGSESSMFKQSNTCYYQRECTLLSPETDSGRDQPQQQRNVSTSSWVK